jgi:hypothetical protein
MYSIYTFVYGENEKFICRAHDLEKAFLRFETYTLKVGNPEYNRNNFHSVTISYQRETP